MGLDLSEWKDDISRAKKEYQGLVKGVGSGLKQIGIGTVAIAGSMTALFGMTELVAAQSRVFEQLQVHTRAADNEMQALKEDVYELNTALGLRSVSTAAEKMGMVARLSRKTGDELKQLTYQTGLLGREFGQEEEQLAAQVAIMQSYKTSVSEAGDVVAFLNSQGGDIKGELLESIKEYSVQFSEAGFSLNQTVAILKEGLSQGWNVDKAADAFKEGRLRLMGGDKATVDALKLLGLSDLDNQIKSGLVSIPQAMGQIQGELSKLNKTEQFRIAKEIFGSQYEDVGETAMTAMLSGMNKKMQTTGAIDLMTQSLHGRFSYKWDAAVSNLTNSFSRLIEDLKPHILPAIEWFSKLTSGISDFSKKYQYIVKSIGAGIATFTILAGVLGVIAVAAGVFGIALAIITSPLTLILLAVLAVAAGLIYMEAKFGSVSKAWDETVAEFDRTVAAFKRLGDDIGKAWDSIKDYFTRDTGFYQDFIKPIEDFFKTGLGKLFIDTISSWGKTIHDELMGPINKIRNSAVGKFLFGGYEDPEKPKTSAKNIRGQGWSADKLGEVANGWSLTGVPGIPVPAAPPSQEKRTIVNIQNYHSNSRNSAADWYSLGWVAK